MSKRKFTNSERYAVWLHQGNRCWFCEKPLRFGDTTIDHVIPEWLLNNEEKRKLVFIDYGLDLGFNINGFETGCLVIRAVIKKRERLRLHSSLN